MSKKIAGLLASIGLAAAVGGGLWISHQKSVDPASAPSLPGFSTKAASPVSVLTGSAKIPYLNDPEMAKILRDAGFALALEKTGSFADDALKASKADVVFPAGAAAAADFQKLMPGSESFAIFETPLAIASWKPLLPTLKANGLSKPFGTANPPAAAGAGVAPPSYDSFELEAALPIMLAKKRWTDLASHDAYPINRSILVNTPDARKSATASQFIAALAFVRGGNEPPSTAAAAKFQAQALSSLISRQGFQEGTLAGPFEDYLSPSGFGKAPLVLIYESQFIQAKIAGTIDDRKTLLYPNPAITLKHMAIGRTPEGKRLAAFLAQDPAAQRIAARYGFRINDSKLMAEEFAKAGYAAPEFLNIAVLPTSDAMEALQASLIESIELAREAK